MTVSTGAPLLAAPSQGAGASVGLQSEVHKHNLTDADPQHSAITRPLPKPQGAGHPADPSSECPRITRVGDSGPAAVAARSLFTVPVARYELSSRPEEIIAKAMICAVEGPCVVDLIRTVTTRNCRKPSIATSVKIRPRRLHG